jgi:hypothetical protein
MAKEKLSSVLARYGKAYYVPHPWDNWVKTHQEEVGPGTHFIKVKPEVVIPIKNTLGNIVKMKVIKTSDWDWDSRYFTTNCPNCPHYIPVGQESTHLLISSLRASSGRARLDIPISYHGICNFGRTKIGLSIRKFLVDNPYHSIRKCGNKLQEREERAEQKRQKGELEN